MQKTHLRSKETGPSVTTIKCPDSYQYIYVSKPNILWDTSILIETFGSYSTQSFLNNIVS